MAVTIRRPELDPPRKGVHLRATSDERRVAHGYKGHAGLSGPLCNTGDGHYRGTAISGRVTCPCCIQYLRDRLRYSITEEQEGILNAARP